LWFSIAEELPWSRQWRGEPAMIETMLRPVMLLDSLGVILSANESAESALRRRDIIWRGSNGRLVLSDAEAQDRMPQKLAAVASGDAAARAISVVSMPGRRPFRLRLFPTGADVAARIRAVLHDPAMPAIYALDDIRDAFVLMSAEFRVAIAIADGLTLAAVAREREAAMATVRNQLKSVLSKTGCKRQAELAALLRHFIDD
jgi:DNA-binding CsgD family transcriptional regulator